jgi:hypothetical protein
MISTILVVATAVAVVVAAFFVGMYLGWTAGRLFELKAYAEALKGVK